MTSDEIARLLETFRKKFTPNAVVPPETVALWNEQFRSVHRDLMRPAAKACLANEESFPKPAKLRWYLKEAADAAQAPREPRPRRTTPGVCQEDCDHGWKESTVRETRTGHRDGQVYEFTYPPGVYPCPTCRREQYDRWHDKWVPQALSNQPIKPTTTFTYNPKAMIDQNRDMLANLATMVKDPDDLDSLEDL